MVKCNCNSRLQKSFPRYTQSTTVPSWSFHNIRTRTLSLAVGSISGSQVTSKVR